jgi:hypothetical protein
MATIADKIASRQAYLLVEMTTFNEEQNLRRQFGPGIFKELCREMKAECDRINASARVKAVSHEERPPLSCGVRNLANGDVASVSYQSLAATIHCEVKSETEEIMLRINKHPEPSVHMVFRGVPCRAQEVASILIADLL